ncbi:MAG: hypothetical protein ACRELE_08795, partial [Gemmatimonadales bacterium]
AYWSEQVDIQRQVATAWVLYAEGKRDDALSAMSAAADAEDKTEKHPVTPYDMHTSSNSLLRRVPFSESMLVPRCLGEQQMEGSLGRFGDRRLEKGGPACWLGWFVWANRASACAGWVAIVPARCALLGSCVIGG